VRILIYGLNYAPELIGIGKYTAEMAEWLSDRGSQVRVVTSLPYYPKWEIFEGYTSKFYMRERMNGVDVWRCPLFVPRNKTVMKRVIHLLSFTCLSVPLLLLQLVWKPDIVITVVPTVFCAPQSWLLSKICGSRSWLHIHDFEVGLAFIFYLNDHRLLRKIAIEAENKIISRFNRVSTISENMVNLLKKKGLPAEHIVLFPNWVDTSSIYPLNFPSPMRRELGLIEDDIVILYSGNLGEKQGLDIIAQIADRVRRHKHIKFILCGAGGTAIQLRKQLLYHGNMQFLELQPIEKLNHLLNLADIHILPQRDKVGKYVMPSKLTGMLASGRPVVASAEKNSSIGKILDKCGIIVPPGDVTAFAESLLELSENSDLRKSLGSEARLHAERYMDKEKILQAFYKQIHVIHKHTINA